MKMTDRTLTEIRRLRRDERGATAIEYGLIAALVSVAIIAALQTLGGNTNGSWGSTATKVSDAMK